MAQMEVWDSRDRELGLREKFARLVAQKVSGAEGAAPLSDDYEMADRIAALIEDDQ